jgi:hypothetical protein
VRALRDFRKLALDKGKVLGAISIENFLELDVGLSSGRSWVVSSMLLYRSRSFR